MTDDNIINLPLKMPAPLAQQVRVLSAPPNPDYAELAPLEPTYDPQASAWLKRKRELIKQASREDCHDWLIMVSTAVNGVTEDLVARREIALWMMCDDLPSLVWCRDTVLKIWQVTKFLPTPGEVRPVLEAHVAPLLAEIAALERIAAAPKLREIRLPPYEVIPRPACAIPPPKGVPRADDERSYAASVRRVQAELAARKPISTPKPSDPEPPDSAA